MEYNDINKESNKFNISLCQQIIDKARARLKLVIDQGANKIQEH